MPNNIEIRPDIPFVEESFPLAKSVNSAIAMMRRTKMMRRAKRCRFVRWRPIVDADGSVALEQLTTAMGDAVKLPVKPFVVDESGERILHMVGTGKADGPGANIRFEDVLEDGESVGIAGGIQFSV